MLDQRQMDGTQAGERQKTVIAEFEGYTESPLFSETCRISLEKDGLAIVGGFHQLPILYGEIFRIRAGDYRLELETAGGGVTFSRMGSQLQWLADKLMDAFNDAVAEALLAKGEPLMTARCEYFAEEGDASHQGKAAVRLYEDCLCILPPSENARRVPLCWLTGLEKKNETLELILASGEHYTLSRMGRDLDELDRRLTGQLRTLGEKTLAWHKELAPALGSMQASASCSLMPLGRAGEFGKLRQMAPPLAAVLEEKLGQSRMADTFPWLWELCGGKGLMLGAILAPEKREDEPSAEAPDEQLPILWLIAPDREKRIAAVELALGDNEAAATYLYRVEGSWEDFARLVDRTLDAAGFQREMILLPEDKLASPEHMKDAMLVKRTPALQTLRRCFAGRAIHSSQERWRRDIDKCREAAAGAVRRQVPASKQTNTLKFCTNCGAKLAPNVRFCGNCGNKLM